MPATDSDSDNPAVVGIDVGGTKVLVHVEDECGQLVLREPLPSGREIGPSQLVMMIEEIIERARQVVPVRAVGIGFPGLTNVDQGIVLSSVILDGWENVYLAEVLAKRLGVFCVVDNDVNNAARAELAIRGNDARNMLFTAVGSGVGGALVLAGQLWSGACGLAGELGHVTVDQEGPRCLCGRIGCAGPRASGHAIAERLGTTSDVAVRLARAGDAKVWSAIEETTVFLGKAIASALNLLNLPLVVIGGGVADLGEQYIKLVERTVRAEAFPEIAAACRIELARAGYEAGASGAALLARERLSRANLEKPRNVS
jgi:glucokinase